MKILDIGANDGWWYRNMQPNYPDAEFTLIEARRREKKSVGVKHNAKPKLFNFLTVSIDNLKLGQFVPMLH